MNRQRIIWLVIFLVGAAALKVLLPFPQEQLHPSVVPEPVMLIGGFVVTNSLLITLVVDLLLILTVIGATRRLSLVPGGLQNAMEITLEAIMRLVRQTVSGDEKRIRWFFPFVITIFLFLVPANLLGLMPGFGPLGILHYDRPDQHTPQGVTPLLDLPASSVFQVPPELRAVAQQEEAKTSSEAEFVPLFRAPSSDLNTTLALALVSWVMTQFFGFRHLGVLGYLRKYFVFDKLRRGIGGLFSGKTKGVGGMLVFGVIDFAVGILELISEFSKVISFTFRLFGNIFAGEVVLLVMAFLFPLLPLPFYGLETLVGVIQAFIFAILTLVFMTGATTPAHGAEEHH
ncbi:MAG: F0F1 ATP synthase subunit A [Chloroflexi bacterium]|nr:F0F1 ATP synthase subunit A [Chloroflexota bacterium]MBI3733532.1 F0F1 ATP synthase subunit A [Chloroflexota bacterium]